jgi:hypothetical protein
VRTYSHFDIAAIEFHDIHRGEVELANEGMHGLPCPTKYPDIYLGMASF